MALPEAYLVVPRTLAVVPVGTQANDFNFGVPNSVGKVVSYLPDQTHYACIADNGPGLGTPPFQIPSIPAFTTYSALTTYNVGDGVTKAEAGETYYWISSINNNTTTPGTGGGFGNWYIYGRLWTVTALPFGLNDTAVYLGNNFYTTDPFPTSAQPPATAVDDATWKYLSTVNTQNSLYWTPVAVGEPMWDTQNTYQPGDVVSFTASSADPVLYLSLSQNVGQLPSSSPLDWKPMGNEGTVSVNGLTGSVLVTGGLGIAVTEGTLNDVVISSSTTNSWIIKTIPAYETSPGDTEYVRFGGWQSTVLYEDGACCSLEGSDLYNGLTLGYQRVLGNGGTYGSPSGNTATENGWVFVGCLDGVLPDESIVAGTTDIKSLVPIAGGAVGGVPPPAQYPFVASADELGNILGQCQAETSLGSGVFVSGTTGIRALATDGLLAPRLEVSALTPPTLSTLVSEKDYSQAYLWRVSYEPGVAPAPTVLSAPAPMMLRSVAPAVASAPAPAPAKKASTKKSAKK